LKDLFNSLTLFRGCVPAGECIILGWNEYYGLVLSEISKMARLSNWILRCQYRKHCTTICNEVK